MHHSALIDAAADKVNAECYEGTEEARKSVYTNATDQSLGSHSHNAEDTTWPEPRL